MKATMQAVNPLGGLMNKQEIRRVLKDMKPDWMQAAVRHAEPWEDHWDHVWHAVNYELRYLSHLR